MRMRPCLSRVMIHALAVLAMCVRAAPAAAQTFLGCYNGHEYYLTSSGSVHNAQAAANAFAAQHGVPAYLVTLGSAAEDDWLRGRSPGWKWIGLNDLASTGSFQWSNGEPVAYTRWFNGEPTLCGAPSGGSCSGNRSQEHYVQTHHHLGVYWNDLSDLNTNTYAPGVIEVEPATPAFTPTVVPGSVTVQFHDDTPGAGSWVWDFGDGQTSFEQHPTHDYQVPPCHRQQFTVKLSAGTSSACAGPTEQLISVYNEPAPGSAGKAVVIIGDVHGPQIAASAIDEAALKAIQRFQQSGYEITEPIGNAMTGNYATLDAIETALRDATVTAVWIVGHGAERDFQTRTENGLTFWAKGLLVRQERVREWRQGRPPLKELTISSCWAGAAFDPSAWGTDANTVVNINNPDPGSARGGDRAVVLGAEALRLEKAIRCDPPIGPEPAAVARRETRHSASGADGYLPMLLMTSDGVLGDSLYGTIAGSTQTVVADALGEAAFSDAAAGIAGRVTGRAAGDSITLWMNRYTALPADTLPPARICVAAFFLDGTGSAAGTELALGYGSPAGPASALDAWWFDDSLRTFVQLDATVDSLAGTIGTSIEHWGQVLITAPADPVAVGDPGATARLWLAVAGNPVRPGKESAVRFAIPAGGPVRLRVYNLAGALVATLVDREMQAGAHTIPWDGTASGGSPPAGVFFVALEANGQKLTKPVVLLR